MHTRPIITLLTDFGTRDPYVAAMKGVILSLRPDAVLVDLTHEVPPQDIVAGAFLLAEATPYFPPGTIHLAVVDPGVGTQRRALAAHAREQFWVGPDNGLFHLVFRENDSVDIVSLENPEYFRGAVPLNVVEFNLIGKRSLRCKNIIINFGTPLLNQKLLKQIATL